MKINFELPLNSLSFGQVGYLILRTLYEKVKNGENHDITLFPIGNIDLSSQKPNEDFNKWIISLIKKGLETHTRDIPTFKLWHLNGSLQSLSNKQTLLTFYELDNPTKVELNIARNNNLCLSSKYSCSIFDIFGQKSNYLPLAFDSFNFSRLEKKFHNNERIVTNLCGKIEARKKTAQVIKAWIKAFGNNRKYHLQCAIFNPFFTPEQNNEIIKNILGGEKPFNITFYPIMKENMVYNEFLNSGDVIIDMSSAEGFSLPSFQSVAIGKHAVILNAHVLKDWANSENSILVNPSGKEVAVDNIFFKRGDTFNQGSWFVWDDEEFIEGCKVAYQRVEKNKLNEAGLKLQEIYTKEKFVDSILNLTSQTNDS